MLLPAETIDKTRTNECRWPSSRFTQTFRHRSPPPRLAIHGQHPSASLRICEGSISQYLFRSPASALPRRRSRVSFAGRKPCEKEPRKIRRTHPGCGLNCLAQGPSMAPRWPVYGPCAIQRGYFRRHGLCTASAGAMQGTSRYCVILARILPAGGSSRWRFLTSIPQTYSVQAQNLAFRTFHVLLVRIHIAITAILMEPNR